MRERQVVEALHEPVHRSADAHIRVSIALVGGLADVGIRAPVHGSNARPMLEVEASHEPISPAEATLLLN